MCCIHSVLNAYISVPTFKVHTLFFFLKCNIFNFGPFFSCNNFFKCTIHNKYIYKVASSTIKSENKNRSEFRIKRTF